MLTVTTPQGCHILNAQVLHRGTQSLGHDLRAGRRAVVQKYDEFLAAVARQYIIRTHQCALQSPSYVAQAAVAHRVTVAIIEQLEVIDVDHQDCLASGTALAAPGPCQRLGEEMAIGYAGQCIGPGNGLQRRRLSPQGFSVLDLKHLNQGCSHPDPEHGDQDAGAAPQIIPPG